MYAPIIDLKVGDVIAPIKALMFEGEGSIEFLVLSVKQNNILLDYDVELLALKIPGNVTRSEKLEKDIIPLSVIIGTRTHKIREWTESEKVLYGN